jgi:hypothetical protein
LFVWVKLWIHNLTAIAGDTGRWQCAARTSHHPKKVIVIVDPMKHAARRAVAKDLAATIP